MPFKLKSTQEEFLARLTEAAYDVLLNQGLRRSFVDVELELWQRIRGVFHSEVLPHEPRGRDALDPPLTWAEVA